MSLCLKRNWLIEVPLMRWFFPAAVLATTIVGSLSFIRLLCFGLVSSVPLRVVYLVVFGILLFLFLWSYLCAMILPLPTPPRRFNPSTEERRYCEICESFKPERAHHCRVCDVCILKYDHHCFWINNCTSYNNHKAFILFILYALLLCAGTSAVILVHLIVFAAEKGWPWQSFNASEWILFAELVFLVAILLLLGRFAGVHLSRVAKNQTEVEWLSNVRHYDLGCGNNFKEVFGDIRLLWLFPVQTTRGDGVHWPRNDWQNEV